MRCTRCDGRKYIELDKVGLVVTECPDCDGTGETDWERTMTNALMPRLEGEKDDIISRTEPDNSPTGSADTGKPKRSRKSKKKAKPRA